MEQDCSESPVSFDGIDIKRIYIAQKMIYMVNLVKVFYVSFAQKFDRTYVNFMVLNVNKNVEKWTNKKLSSNS